MALVARKPLASFFVLAYGLSWAYWIPLALAGVRTAPGSTATHEPGLLGPALAAFLVTGLTQGAWGLPRSPVGSCSSRGRRGGSV